LVAIAMVGAAFAAVPLYRAFCQATGFDGTPRRSQTGPSGAGDRMVGIRFDTNVRDLPWTLRPDVNSQTVRVGRTQLTNFTITNNGDKAMTGRAAYNVAPESAAHYFTKLQCFCFSDQTIAAHTSKTFPVVYYVDSKFAADPDNEGVKELTLSYTLFRVRDVNATSR
jgi:cytochrome c oxidase assembly protein subunit 11